MKKLFCNVLLMTLPALVLMTTIVRADEPAKNPEPTISVTPIVNYVTVKGDKEKFREDWWMKDQWTGGVDEFTLNRKLGGKGLLSVEGRAIFDQHDYNLRLEIANPDIGFVRAGYTEFRKYFDGTGGFYGPFTTKFFELSNEQYLNIRDLYFEAGLTLPNWPTFLVGYERKSKHGSKSMIEWGSVVQTGTTRKIYPAYKTIDDTVDILKAEAEHNVGNVHMADQFRYENYRITTLRLDDATLTLPAVTPGKTVIVNEHYAHDAFFNTFLLDSHVSEKVYWSAGYLFTKLAGNPDMAINTVTNGAAFSSTDKFWSINSASVDQNSHVLNVNALFGPYAKTYLYGGIQAEKTETDGLSDAALTEGTGTNRVNEVGLINTRNDKDWFTERTGIRYLGIPWTTLYAEGKWEQGNVSLFEQEFTTGLADPTIASETTQRFTDADVTREDYRIGFSTAPIRRVNLSAYYRYNKRINNYNNLIDQVVVVTNGVPVVEPQDGYSAFIDRQQFSTDEVGAKLSIQPTSRIALSVKYQMVATDIKTKFADPAANNQSGNYDANIYSVSATVTPINRLYCTALFSYQDTRTIAQDNGSTAIVTYHGNVYSALAAIGCALDSKTDLRTEYSASFAHNTQNNVAAGLPLGTDYKRHGVQVTLSRRLRENLTARIGYGYYKYNDDATGGVNDYEAHLGSASCTLQF